jgi:hypothetical protein
MRIAPSLAIAALFVSLGTMALKGQSTEINNWVAIGSGSSYLLTLSKDLEQVGSFTIPVGRDFVIGFNQSQPHSHDADGNRFEFHGDFRYIRSRPAMSTWAGSIPTKQRGNGRVKDQCPSLVMTWTSLL